MKINLVANDRITFLYRHLICVKLSIVMDACMLCKIIYALDIKRLRFYLPVGQGL